MVNAIVFEVLETPSVKVAAELCLSGIGVNSSRGIVFLGQSALDIG